MLDSHPLACGRELARRATEHGRSRADVAREIYNHCGHSLLRSYRLAYGLTLAQLVERVSEEYEAEHAVRCHLNTSRLSKWERGEEDPGKKYVALLCRTFAADPVALGIVAGMRDARMDPTCPPPGG